MNDSKPKYRFSIISVVIIFLLIYLGELGIGVGIFFKFILPKINSFIEAKSASLISQNIISDQTSIYSLLKQSKLDEASKSAQMMLSHSKNQNERALSLQVIGEIFAAQNNYLQAKIYFNNAISLSSNLPGAYIGLAEANLIDKDYQKAITNAQRAINLAPKRTDFYYVLGLAYFGTGDKNKAVSNIQKAVDGNPSIAVYKQTLDSIKNGTFQKNQPSNSVQSNNTPQQPSGPGYTKTDIDNLVTDLNRADQDYKTLADSYKGVSTYNQTTINRVLQIIPQRKTLAQQLLDKMGKGQSLTQADFSTWDQYGALTAEQNNLVKTLYNGNGGY